MAYLSGKFIYKTLTASYVLVIRSLTKQNCIEAYLKNEFKMYIVMLSEEADWLLLTNYIAFIAYEQLVAKY